MMILALYAALAMVAQDLLAVLLVQAEARNHALLAGVLDTVGWPAGMICTTITVTALQGHNLGMKATVIAAVSVANFAASYGAVRIGQRHIRDRKTSQGICPCANCAGAP